MPGVEGGVNAGETSPGRESSSVSDWGCEGGGVFPFPFPSGRCCASDECDIESELRSISEIARETGIGRGEYKSGSWGTMSSSERECSVIFGILRAWKKCHNRIGGVSRDISIVVVKWMRTLCFVPCSICGVELSKTEVGQLSSLVKVNNQDGPCFMLRHASFSANKVFRDIFSNRSRV